MPKDDPAPTSETSQADSIGEQLVSAVWEREDVVALERLFAEGCESTFSHLGPARFGKREYFHRHQVLKTFVPDLHFTRAPVAAGPDEVLFHWEASGNHGYFAESTLKLRPIRISGSFWGRLERGKFVETRTHWDRAGLETLLGTSSVANEVDIRVNGSRDGTPLVFIPTDFLPGWRTWARFTEVFQKERPVVNLTLMVNREAYLRRPVPSEYSLRMEIDAIERAIERAGIPRPFDIVGWSIGGATTLELAAKHPDWIRSMVLVEPSANFRLPEEAMDSYTRDAIETRLKGYTSDGPITDDELARFFVDAGVFSTLEESRRYELWPLYCIYKQVLQHRALAWSHRMERDALERIQAPVLLATGNRSLPFYRTIADYLTSIFPECARVVLNGTHRCFTDDRERFILAMREFHGRFDLKKAA